MLLGGRWSDGPGGFRQDLLIHGIACAEDSEEGLGIEDEGKVEPIRKSFRAIQQGIQGSDEDGLFRWILPAGGGAEGQNGRDEKTRTAAARGSCREPLDGLQGFLREGLEGGDETGGRDELEPSGQGAVPGQDGRETIRLQSAV